MVKPIVYEGTWRELAAHAVELDPHKKLQLIVLPQDDESHYRADLTPEERIQMLDALAEMNRNLPGLPDDAFDREKLYEDVP